MRNWVPGIPVNIPRPETVNIVYKYHASGTDPESPMVEQTFPLGLCVQSRQSDPYVEFKVAPGFSSTLHKAQGYTLPFTILQINKRPHGCGLGRLSFSSLYVGMSRTRSIGGIRVFPPLGTGFQHILDMRPDQTLLDWISIKKGDLLAPRTKRHRKKSPGATKRNTPHSRKKSVGDTKRNAPKGKRDRENVTHHVEERSAVDVHLIGIRPKGIRNLGNTCYINSLFQCMCRLPVFMRKIAEPPGTSSPLYKFLAQLISGDETIMSPETLRSHLPFPYDVSNLQHDVSEFFAAVVLKFRTVEEAFTSIVEVKLSCSKCDTPCRTIQDNISHILVPLRGCPCVVPFNSRIFIRSPKCLMKTNLSIHHRHW